MVKELFPALVSVVGQMDVDHRISFGTNGFGDQRHSGLVGSPTALAGVTPGTRTNQIFPRGFASQTSRDNMIQRKFGRRISLAAVLASVSIPSENIPAVEFYRRSRKTIVHQESNDFRNRDIEMNRRNPVVFGRLKFLAIFADLTPCLEIIIAVGPPFTMNHFRQITKQQGNGSSGADDTQGHIVLVENKDSGIQNRLADLCHFFSPLGIDHPSIHNDHSINSCQNVQEILRVFSRLNPQPYLDFESIASAAFVEVFFHHRRVIFEKGLAIRRSGDIMLDVKR